MSYEIHPETPPSGRSLAEYFDRADLAPMHDMLRRRAEEFGLTFAGPETLSNSRLAILAAEYARDRDRHAEFSRGIFAAYFAEGRDIGDIDVLVDLATATGLDAAGLRRSLESGGYAGRLAEAEAAARRLGITGVPTFFVARADGGAADTAAARRIVGAQPLDVFREVLRQV